MNYPEEFYRNDEIHYDDCDDYLLYECDDEENYDYDYE